VSTTDTPTPAELSLIDAYWRAANYLSVGQISLLDNPLARCVTTGGFVCGGERAEKTRAESRLSADGARLAQA
jgi:phosphoketolase